MTVRFFPDATSFRDWLSRHHDRDRELWVGFHKRHTGTPSLTWPESVDEALCFGWIDGLRKSIDSNRYKIRFTPRKAGSVWSAVNLARVKALTKAGRMHAAGIAAHRRRKPANTDRYSYEQRHQVALAPAYQQALEGDSKAWKFFSGKPPSYRKAAIHWVMSAKKEATRERRLATLIADSAAGRPIPPLRYGRDR